MRILVVEDEKKISEIVIKYLQKSKYEVFLAENGIDALSLFNSVSPDLIILDIMIPYINGFDVLEEIRRISIVPVIILSAKSSFDDRIDGLEMGANDYLVKPFSPKELLLRIENLLGKESMKGQTAKLGTVSINLENGKCNCKNGDYILTRNELKLLKLLMNNEGKIFSRDNLITKIFGYDYEGFDRNIDTLIKKLRRKINDNSKEPNFIKTKYGKGYYFEKN